MKQIEKVSSTNVLSEGKVKNCLEVLLYTYWNRLHIFDDPTKGITKRNGLDYFKVLNSKGDTLVSFRNQKLGNQVFKLLKAGIQDKKDGFPKRVLGFLGQMNEYSQRNMLKDLIDEHQSADFPWPWKINRHTKSIMDGRGATLFFFHQSAPFSIDILEDIIALKSTTGPVEMPQRTAVSVY